MLVVIDTNILVSALWSRNGAPAKILGLVINGNITPCYDWRILSEYQQVLSRPKFRFSPAETNALLDWIKTSGNSVIANPVEDVFSDESDKKFYEVARTCNATLVTGNLKHYPKNHLVCDVQTFLTRYRTDSG